jgi:hypothetical protein
MAVRRVGAIEPSPERTRLCWDEVTPAGRISMRSHVEQHKKTEHSETGKGGLSWERARETLGK